MNVQKVKSRGWVKNAAIIFLAVMLVLTLFSNTILNRSLPEVATAYTSSGSITAKIRGEGVVTANETYEMKVGQTRDIKSVAVKEGDMVEEGDVILYLADTESEELGTAIDEMDELNYNYQKALIEASYSDYAKENREIQRAREALEDAAKEKEELKVSPEKLDAANAAIAATEGDIKRLKDEVKAAERAYKNADKLVKEIETELSKAIEESGGSSAAAIKELERKVEKLNEELFTLEEEKYTLGKAFSREFEDIRAEGRKRAYKEVWDDDYAGKTCPDEICTVCETYGEHYNHFATDEERTAFLYQDKDIESAINRKLNSDSWKQKIEIYAGYAANGEGVPGGKEFNRIIEIDSQLDSKYLDLKHAKEDLREAQSSENTTEINAIKTRLKNAENSRDKAEDTHQSKKDSQQDAEDLLEERKADLEELKTDREDYKTAVTTEKEAQKKLEDLLFDLADSQRQDGMDSALEALNIKKTQEDMSKKQDEIDELRENAVGAAIESPVSGLVKKIYASAGNTMAGDEIAAEIEVLDRGYYLKMPVTNEQSQKVKPGDKAEISNYYWGPDITAVLQGITNDPDNSQGKMLVFNLMGEGIESGGSLSLAVGQKSQNYEVIVPNSAVRQDTNGYFVLTVTSKSSSLINRMIATRVPVTVLAEDDTNAAIEGGITSYDYVITTSDRPINHGDQVRIAD